MGPTDTPEGYSRAIALGVDGIQTDRPDALVKFLQEREAAR